MVEQVEWFSDGSGNLLGTIAKGKGVAGWNYVILERDKRGDFYVHKVMNNCSSSEVARVDLLLSVVGSEKSDCTNLGTTASRLPPVPAELPQ